MQTLSLFGALLLIAGCQTGATAPQALKIGMIYRASGDPAANSNPALGATVRGATEDKADLQMLESRDADDDLGRLNLLIAQNYDPIFAVGASTAEAVHHTALGYPKRQFVLIDGVADAPNIDSIVVDDARPAFICGALAALASRSGSVAAVVDVSSLRRTALEAGFTAGVRQAAPGTRVTFLAPGPGLSARLTGSGADVVLLAGTEDGEALPWATHHGAAIIGYGTGGNLATVADPLVLAAVLATQQALAQKLPSGVTRVGLEDGMLPFLGPMEPRLGAAGRMKFDAIEKAVVGRRIDPPATAAGLAQFRPIAL